ncbi:MAG TPA: hypothetical protein VFU24_07230 [Burkholderiales bacterium]|nr:hypothetical protein [Burkholderiales bacterium]
MIVVAAVLLAVALPAAAQPALSYDPPAGWKRGPYNSPAVYTAPGGQAELHVYDFQRYDGDVRARLRQTRLFELIGIEHREDRPLEAPKEGELSVQGAGPVPYVTFAEQRSGVVRYHLRVAIPAPGAVALIDFHALTLDAWKRELSAMDRVFASMRVGGAPPAAKAAAPRSAQGASGLYLATVRRMVFRATGGSEWSTSTEFYLLSPEGKVYRGHGLPEVPGGNLARFDYEKARRADPGNSGTYTASGSRVTITVGDERISATLSGQDELEIRGTKFRRSVK